MAISQNGWPVVDKNGTVSYKIAGTTRALRLRTGAAGQLLALFAAWFDKNIETIDNDKVMDDWGWAPRPIRGGTTPSNHGSGTAEDLNATQHSLGVRNTYSDPQEVKIRAELRLLGGAIRGGLDYANRADEMHFEINVPPTAAGYARINAAILVLQNQLAGKPPTGGTVPRPPTGNDYDTLRDKVIASASIRQVANGGYLHVGQAEMRDDVETFLAWWLRIVRNDPTAKAQADRDIRIWHQLVAKADWKNSGIQLTGIIKRFQAHFGLTPDGVFGPKSAAIMVRDDFILI